MNLDEIINGILSALRLGNNYYSQIVVVLMRAIAIIIPPIQGWFIDLIGISLFGPVKSFIVTEIGLVLGSSTAFGISRYFREPLLKRFVSIQKIHQWEERLSKNERFWSWVVIRLPSNLFFDYISYAAGLTRCSFKMFITSTIIGSLPSVIVFYLVSGYAYNNGGWWYAIFAAVALMVLGSIIYRIYKRSK